MPERSPLRSDPRRARSLPCTSTACPPTSRSILRSCADRDIVLIEDAAQALGAAIVGGPAGSFGTGCFSFYATKNITTGEGGVVTTDDPAIAASVRILRDQGQDGVYEYVRPGFNFRMSELHAALGVAQMTRLRTVNEARREERRRAAIRPLRYQGPRVLPVEPSGRRHVFHQFTVRVTPDAELGRDEVRESLAAAGINCGVYYPRPVFDYECFRSDPRIGNPRAPCAEQYAGEVLSLPVHPGLGRSDLERIIEALRKVMA